MGVEQYNLVAHDWLNLEFIINDLTQRVVGQELHPTSSPTFGGVTITGKLAVGSQASPVDVTSTRQHGFELHYSGNNYDVTGIRSRAQLVTTDTSASAQGALLQAANNDGINAGVLQGALIEAIGKSTTTAATISTMRGALIGAEWGALDTVTALNALHVRVHSLNSAGAGSFGTGYGVYIENEAVGGNGQALDAGIYFKGTNLSAGNKAFTYGIDFTGATYATADINLSDGSVINDVNGRWGIGTASPSYKLHIIGTTAADMASSEMGYDLDFVTFPGGGDWSAALIEESGNLSEGVYKYWVEYTTAIGSTGTTNVVTVTTDATHTKVLITLPISSDYRVTGRKAYRTPVGGAQHTAVLLTTINDNTTTTYTDNTADGSLGSETISQKPNTTNKGITKDGTTIFILDSKLTLLGDGAGNFATATGGRATYVGGGAGEDVTTASDNTLVGYQAGDSLTTGGQNTLVGTYAGGNCECDHTVILGRSAGFNVDGSYNTFMGHRTGSNEPSAQSNVFYNVGIGDNALLNIQTGAYRNVAIGWRAGHDGLSGSNNVLLGAKTGDIITTGNDNIIIGFDVDPPAADTNEFLNIGDTIYGDLSTGNVGIGTTAPNAPLEVKGAKPGVVGGFQSGQFQVTGTGGEFYCAVITGHNSFNGNTQLWYLGSTSSSSHNDIAFINRQNAPIHFYTNNTSRMTIDADGTILVKDKLKFTQDDGLEYIDSLADGYMDYGATTAHRFNTPVRSSTTSYRRYYHLSVGGFDPGVSGATWTDPDGNHTGGWRLNAVGETLIAGTDIHSDWDGASDIIVEITFALNAAGVAGNTVDLKIVAYYNGVGDTATKTQTVEVATVTDGTQYKVYKATFTLDYDVVANVIDAGDEVTFILNLETDTSEIDDIIVTGGSFYYNTTHIGIESGDT